MYFKYHQVVNKSDTNQILEASHKQSLPQSFLKEKSQSEKNVLVLKLFVPTKLASQLVSP